MDSKLSPWLGVLCELIYLPGLGPVTVTDDAILFTVQVSRVGKACIVTLLLNPYQLNWGVQLEGLLLASGRTLAIGTSVRVWSTILM